MKSRARPAALPIVALVRCALAEDAAQSDVTSRACVRKNAMARGDIVAKSNLVLAGACAASAAFSEVDARTRVRWVVREGRLVLPGTVVANVQGPARALLAAERVALNFLMHLSGVATLTRLVVDRVPRSCRAKIFDTRKTTPLLRALEKEAVVLGGGINHRRSLADAILIKDNHVALAGGVEAAVSAAKRVRPALPVQCEVTTLDEARRAVAAGADLLLLDNMTPRALARVVRMLRAEGVRVPLEASGGVTLANVAAIARSGVDRISLGALTHSAPAANLSLELHL